MSPYDTPALFNLLQYTELSHGVWYPRGGFFKVVEALENIATTKFGVEFKYNANVTKIVVDDKMVAKGVRFDDGSIDYADIVVCNADLIYAYNHLLPETAYAKKLSETAALTSSSISFYWGMKCQVSELDVHNVFLANDYKASYDNVFKRHILSEDPFFYVNVPSRIDSSAAPDGKDSIVVLLPVSHLSPNNEDCMDEWIKIARDRLIRIIENRLQIKNLESLIEYETINDPRTWQTKFNLWKGSILGMSHNIPQVLHYRPSIRSKEFENLYFVGANAHPGTGGIITELLLTHNYIVFELYHLINCSSAGGSVWSSIGGKTNSQRLWFYCTGTRRLDYYFTIYFIRSYAHDHFWIAELLFFMVDSPRNC